MNKMTQKTQEIEGMNFLGEKSFHLVQIIEIRRLHSIIRAILKLVLLKILRNNDFIFYPYYLINLKLREVII